MRPRRPALRDLKVLHCEALSVALRSVKVSHCEASRCRTATPRFRFQHGTDIELSVPARNRMRAAFGSSTGPNASSFRFQHGTECEKLSVPARDCMREVFGSSTELTASSFRFQHRTEIELRIGFGSVLSGSVSVSVRRRNRYQNRFQFGTEWTGVGFGSSAGPK